MANSLRAWYGLARGDNLLWVVAVGGGGAGDEFAATDKEQDEQWWVSVPVGLAQSRYTCYCDSERLKLGELAHGAWLKTKNFTRNQLW